MLTRASSTSTLSSSSRSSSPERGTSDAVETILSGRKCWRIMKGKNEPVWPPALEAALIEGGIFLSPTSGICAHRRVAGLEKYKPAGTRSTKALGRLPMRNKFVSEYIFKVTGKRRTPKQVGSRIQQLRDTNSGKHSKYTQYHFRRASCSYSVSCEGPLRPPL